MSSMIPDIVISRLPVYLRALDRLAQEGFEVTSSHELGKRLGIWLRDEIRLFCGVGVHMSFLFVSLKPDLTKENLGCQAAQTANVCRRDATESGTT